MYSIILFLERNAFDILLNVAAIILFYLIARLINARPVFALAFAFTPILIALAFRSAPTGAVLRSFF